MSKDIFDITQWYCEKGCGAILNGETYAEHTCDVSESLSVREMREKHGVSSEDRNSNREEIDAQQRILDRDPLIPPDEVIAEMNAEEMDRWTTVSNIVKYIQDLKGDQHDCSHTVMRWFLFELLKLEDPVRVNELFWQSVGEWDK